MTKQTRRKVTPEFKAMVAFEAAKEQHTLAELFKKFEVSAVMISRWKSKINELLKKAEEAAKLEGESFMKIEKQRLYHEFKNNNTILDHLANKQEHLAKIAIDKWYEEELAKTNVSLPTTKDSEKAELENVFWQLIDSSEKIEYCFRNGTVEKELIYTENELVNKWKWSYVPQKNDVIRIDFPDGSVDYSILELTENSLKIQENGTSEVLEFRKN